MPQSQEDPSSQALIVWTPRCLFIPPFHIQDLPPPHTTHALPHIDLNAQDRRQGGQAAGLTAIQHVEDSHTPDREDILPRLILNETFLRLLLNPAPPPPFSPDFIDPNHPDPCPPAQEAILTSPQNSPITKKQNAACEASTLMEEVSDLTNANGLTMNEDVVSINEQSVAPQCDVPMEDVFTPIEPEQSSLESINENPVQSVPEELTPASQASSDLPKPKSKKIVLKRKTPEPTHSFGFDDVFSAAYPEHPDKVQEELERKRSKSMSDEEASQEQWRVGKMPGHQGSHFRSPKKMKVESQLKSPEVEGGTERKQRTFDQSINSTAERILKKPFRPPSRVAPRAENSSIESDGYAIRSAKSPNSKSSASSRASTKTAALTPATTFSPEFDAIFVDTPKSSGTRKSRSSLSQSKVRPAKPFKIPSRQDRSVVPSPNSTLGYGSARTINTQDHARIVALQQEIMETKKALKILADNDEEQIQELVHTWRNAGREIVERLFRDVPKPDHPLTVASTSGARHTGRYSTGVAQSNSSSYWSSSDDNTPILTPEQAEYLRNAPRNADGEPVDDDGNLLIPDGGNEAKFWEELGNERRFDEERYQGGWSMSDKARHSRGADDNGGASRKRQNESCGDSTSGSSDADAEAEVEVEWNYAALMRMMNVDPDLLGFDELTEEWIEYEAEG
ncbi:hypothetical protein IAU59_000292 [Kwoniella sp. CBS 9459]